MVKVVKAYSGLEVVLGSLSLADFHLEAASCRPLVGSFEHHGKAPIHGHRCSQAQKRRPKLPLNHLRVADECHQPQSRDERALSVFKSEVTHRAESGDSTHQTGGGEQCRGADGDVDTQRYEEPRVDREQVLSQCTAG